MDEDYKGHHIQSTAKPIIESGRWIPHVVIRWMRGGVGEEFIQFDVKRGFATEQDAEEAGVTFAKQWIDERKPRIR
jgi:hypothetical protein